MNKKRIVVLGCAGCGKSTLAKNLGEKLNLEVFHLDKFFYKPGWIEEDKEIFIQKMKAAVEKDNWIIDGNYRSSLDIRLSRCDLVIYLDFNRFVSLRGIFKRYKEFKKKQRDTIATGCFEKLDWSFIKWVWSFKSTSKPFIMNKLKEYKALDILVFKTRKQLNKWLEQVENVNE